MRDLFKLHDADVVESTECDIGLISARIDDLCLSLFDLWCEHRRVVPLAKLMRNWPLLTLDPQRIRKLSRALIDLINFDHHAWTENEKTLLFELLDVTVTAAGDLPWI